MKLFDLQGNVPTVTTEALLIPEFSALWTRDKSKNKARAHKELAYVYFRMDYKSLYNNYPIESRDRALAEEILGDVHYKPDEIVQAACDKYDVMQETPSMGFLKDARRCAEELRRYFRTIDFSERDKGGKPVHKATDVSNTLKNCAGIIDSLEKLMEKVAKEQLTNGSIRGGGQGGYFEFQ